MLLLAVLVGDPVDIGVSALIVILAVTLSLYVRHLPAERIGNMEPTIGFAAIRIFTMGGLFVLVAFVVSGFSAAEFADLARRPSAVVAAGEIAVGAFVGITFPYSIDKVAHPRAVHTVENVLVVCLFAGLFVTHQGSGLLFGGAYLVARSTVMSYKILMKV
ncbi:hypothetical protein [Halovivax ruber]|nr:hypothetical protein [Halovivax ruber]